MRSPLEIARETFSLEAAEIQKMTQRLDADFENACKTILACEGSVVVCGVGKSGLIGRKISATLASTGIPSFFVHPTDAFHGDLGMITPKDVVVSISNSGETNELLKLVPYFKHLKLKHITITGNRESTLARHASSVLDAGVDEEACPLQLVPTASTTNALVMGDALTIALMELRNFKREDFAQFHPGGNLGKRLLGKVQDYMVAADLPVLSPEADGETIIDTMTRGKLGLAIVTEGDTIRGVITDGDLRRALQQQKSSFFALKAEDFMTRSPKTISEDASLVEAEAMMNQHKITSLLAVREGKLSGVIQIYHIQ